MWQAVGQSAQGTSHVASSTPCQDAQEYRAFDTGEGAGCIIAVSDGAGSAAKADIASKLATVTAIEEFIAMEKHPSSINRDDMLAVFQKVRERLLEAAKNDGAEWRDYSCTLLIAGLSSTTCVFAQVGDGCIVTGNESGFKAVTWPHNGEFANQTTFVVSSTFPAALQFESMQRDFDFVALFTDGIQDLALTYATKTVHDRFFPSFRNGLLKAEDTTSLLIPLLQFLNSSAVNQRTDDDKTLAMACWRDEIYIT